MQLTMQFDTAPRIRIAPSGYCEVCWNKRRGLSVGHWGKMEYEMCRQCHEQHAEHQAITERATP